MQSIKSILSRPENNILAKIVKKDKYINYAFQEIGLELAEKLNDVKHISLYMKIAKSTPEGLLRNALSFALDYNLKSGNRARIFMWKYKQLKQEINQDAK